MLKRHYFPGHFLKRNTLLLFSITQYIQWILLFKDVTIIDKHFLKKYIVAFFTFLYFAFLIDLPFVIIAIVMENIKSTLLMTNFAFEIIDFHELRRITSSKSKKCLKYEDSNIKIITDDIIFSESSSLLETQMNLPCKIHVC